MIDNLLLMASPPPENSPVEALNQHLQSFVRSSLSVMLSGFIILIPFVILIYLFDLALGLVRGILEPVIRVLEWAGIIQMATFGFVGQALIEIGIYDDILGFFTELVAVLFLIGLIVLLGIFASFRAGKLTIQFIDAVISRIPGIGRVYQSLRLMGDMILESGLEDFRAVKIVEFPHADLFSIAFETNKAPQNVVDSIGGEDMVTLFVPLAPNPVMGGFLIHVSRDRVFDIDMTIEEAARAIVSSGIAAGDARGSTRTSQYPFPWDAQSDES